MSSSILAPNLTVIEEYAAKNWGNNDLVKILEGLKNTSEGKKIRLDLSYNRFTIDIIPYMINWLKDNQQYSIQVKANSFCFNAFYASCKSEEAVKFISDRRLNMSQTDEEWAIEILALRALDEDRILQINDLILQRERVSKVDNSEHCKRMKELDNQNNVVNQRIAKLNKSLLHLTGWHQNQTDGFEELITTALKRSLCDSGFDIIEIVDKYKRKLPKIDIDGIDYRGIEWDGIIHCSKGDAEYLYLVEAKTTISLAAIQNSCERIVRTQDFITLCQDVELAEKIKKSYADVKKIDKEVIKLIPSLPPLCRLWRHFKNSKIQFVIGALTLSPEIIEMCVKNGYITVCRNLDFFSISDYSLSTAESENEKKSEKKYYIDDLNDEITLGDDDFNDLKTDL